MAAETKHEKAVRYLAERRICVTRVDPDTKMVVATAQGSAEARYSLGYDPEKREWRCTCPARTRLCAHLIALQLIVASR